MAFKTQLLFITVSLLFYFVNSWPMFLPQSSSVQKKDFMSNYNDLVADCTKFDSCYVKFCNDANLKNPNGSIPSTAMELDQAMGRALQKGGKDAFITICNSLSSFGSCMGSPKNLDSCLSVGQLLSGGNDLQNAIMFAEIYQEAKYFCGAGYQTMINDWQCMDTIAKEKQTDFIQCNSLYRSQMDFNPAKACHYSQTYASCASTLFSPCGKSAVQTSCQQVRAAVNVYLRNCQIQCTGGGAVQKPTEKPSTGGPMTFSYYKGSLVDLNRIWDPAYSDPNNAVTQQAIKQYEEQLTTVLGYENMIVNIINFTYELMGSQNYVKVSFLLKIPTTTGSSMPSAQVKSRLVSAAADKRYNWQEIELTDLFDGSTTPQPQIGNSPTWQRAAQLISEAIDETLNPCDDFYKFACGNWMKTHDRADWSQQAGTFFQLTIDAIMNVSSLLTNIKLENAIHTVQQGKIYYDACIGGVVQGNDTGYILNLLSQYGNWPTLAKDWKGPVGGASLGSAEALIGRLFGTIGVMTFLQGQPFADWNMPKRHVVLIAPSNALFSPFTPPDTVAEEIFKVMKVLAMAGNIEVNETKFKADALEIAQIEINLAKLPNPQLGFPFPYNIFNVSSAQQRWTYWNWTAVFEWIAKDNIDPGLITKQAFIMPVLTYFDQLGAVFTPIGERAMQNFLLWRLVATQIQQLPSFKEHRDAIYKLKMGTKAAPPQTLICANDAITKLPWASGRVYVDDWLKQVPANTNPVLEIMINNVLGAFDGMLSTLKWIDAPSKAAAYNKVQNVVKNIAYPEFLMNDEKLNAMHALLDMKESDDTFIKVNKVMRFTIYTAMQDIGQPVDRTNMMRSPAVVNAWYMPQYNNINFPAAILNDPFYHADRPWALNFGMLGAVMGHELTHGFDTMGVKWGPFGKYYPNGWMTNTSMLGFGDMATCVIDEYNDFCFPQIQMCVRGDATVQENIADNGGLMAAYRGYKSVNQLRGPEPRLPGSMSKYSMEQVFFMAFGYNWCTNETDNALAGEIMGGGHSPNQVRVTETLKNIPQFAQAFNCPIGSNMAPKKHCHVWVN